MAMKRTTIVLSGLGAVSICGAGAFEQACSAPSCEEIHDPACFDAGAADGSPEASESDVIIAVGDAHADGPDAAPVCSFPTSLACNGTCVDPTQPAHCGS